MTLETYIALLVTLVCGCIDARTGFIPNRITYPAFSAILLIAAVSHRIDSAALGVLCVGGSLTLLYAVTRGRGLGLGDVKLAACIGAGFGPLYGTIALGSSFIAGGIVGSYLLLARRADRKTPIRFGPFLAAGTLFALAVQGKAAQWF